MRQEWERSTLLAELNRQGSVQAVAKALEINRTHLHRKLKMLGIRTLKPQYAHRGDWRGV